jgi:hypothetical protein
VAGGYVAAPPNTVGIVVLAWAEIHQDELVANWRRLIDDEPIQKIASLR